MQRLVVLMLAVSFSVTAAEKQPHLRFWRGFVSQGANEARLKERLNKELLPETIKVGAGRGLVAYLPALLPENRPEYLPAEIALVAYSSKEEYDAIRSTPEGKAYGELHFVEGMFEKQTKEGYVSKSEVAAPFTGKVELQNDAVVYGVAADTIDWQKGYAFLHILNRKGSDDIASISTDAASYLRQLESLKKQQRLNAALVLVNQKYLMTLLNFKDESQARDYARSSVFIPKGFESYDGYFQHPGEAFEPRQLLNFQFDPKTKP